jgi:two-component system, chemotaxis family, protein-glutamate methylesterase/glutaminase
VAATPTLALARDDARTQATRPGRRRVSAIGVCASTGGPKALAAMLGQLPPDFPIPVVVVQHIVPGFEESLASTIDRCTRISVGLARAGMRLEPGAWIAPAGAHLRLGASRRLESTPRRGNDDFCPSGNELLASLGWTLGSESVGVVLTGMGDDGARGISELQAAGGLAIAQDEGSSAVWGMPRAAAESGAGILLEPREIGRLLARLEPAGGRPETVRIAPPPEGRPHLRLVR